MTRLGDHALVIGASMSGLLAARVLSDFYGKVTLIERDAFPKSDVPRKGVPQGRHTHGLLVRGRALLEQFFPGLTDEVIARGGLCGDIVNDVTWIGHNVALARVPSDLVGLLASRPLLEGQVRRRLLALPNVAAIEHSSVEALARDGAADRITGVVVRREGGDQETIAADFVVDASGRGSASPTWLEQAGYPRPQEQKVDVAIGYMTRTYRRSPRDLGGRLGVIVAGSGPNWRNGAMIALENDTWTVSVGGFLGDDAPADEELFLSYLASLPTSDIHDVVKQAEPKTEFIRYRYVSSLRRCYERLRRFPNGYLVVGDAICSFNPVYGQGMTVAAQEALALQHCLRGGERNLARRFFKAAAKIVDIPWDIAVGNDLRHPKVQGQRPPMLRFINWYIGRLHIAGARDGVLSTAFLKVANLVSPPLALLAPSVAWRVLRGNLRSAARLSPQAGTNVEAAL